MSYSIDLRVLSNLLCACCAVPERTAQTANWLRSGTEQSGKGGSGVLQGEL
jgi:hypothetical protein